MWDGMTGHGWFGGIGMVLFWALILGVVVLLVRVLSGRGDDRSGDAGRSALDMLKVRYARGEIDRQQFEQMKQDPED